MCTGMRFVDDVEEEEEEEGDWEEEERKGNMFRAV